MLISKRNLSTLLGAGVFISLLGGLSAAYAQDGPPQGPPPALVRTEEVRQERLQDRWAIVGRLQEVRRSVLAAEQAGKIIEVAKVEGDAVSAGETVARIEGTFKEIDLRTAQAQLAQAQADVAETTALLDQAKRDREQLEQLSRAGSARPREVQDARAAEQAAEARLQRAKAEVVAAQILGERVRTELRRLEVKAPFDGVVVQKLVEVGQWATPGTPVAELISRGQIDAIIHVPEGLVQTLAVGQTIPVQIDALNREVQGEVSAIVPAGMSAARTFPVKVRLNDDNGTLMPGMSVTVMLPVAQEKDFLTVPRDAVLRKPDGAVVWLNANGQAMPVGVRVLFGTKERYAVEPAGPGLAPGAAVVVEGGERLFPTQPLIVVPETPQ